MSRGVQAAQELRYCPVPPCMEETQGCESQLPLRRDGGLPRGSPGGKGATPRRCTEPQTGSSQVRQRARGGQQPRPRRAGCRVVGEVLVPTQRWTVLVLGVGVRKRIGRREIATLHLKEKEWEEAKKD